MIYSLISAVIISTLFFLFKLWQIKKRIPSGFKSKQTIAGSLTELKHSQDNLEVISKTEIDQQALGQRVNHSYGIDNYQTYFYDQHLIILRLPNPLDLLRELSELPIRKDYLMVPYQNILSWYVNEQKQHLGIKIFIPGAKKDLLVFIFCKLDSQVKDFLRLKIPKLYSSTSFKEPFTSQKPD